MTAHSETRAETVADTLRQAIRHAEYISGERLVELTLAQQMGVSQNTVRDALRILESEGWVVKNPRRGSFVRSFSIAEAAELYALWAAVECLALRWALEGATKASLAQLRRFIQGGRKQTLKGDLPGAVEALFAFHAAIGALAGKAQTLDLLTSLHNRVYLLEIVRQLQSPRSAHAQEAQLILYEKLVSLIETRNHAAAQQLLEYLIMDDCDTLLPLLAETPAAGD
jgi:DNA-binding GntR family transcriptional regulator